MALTDLAEPAVADDLARFGPGPAGAAAHVKYDVPLQSSYCWDRVVELDLGPDSFNEASKEAGTSLQQLCADDHLDSIDRDRLERFYRRALPAAARPSLRLVAEVGGTVDPLLEQLKSRLDRALPAGPTSDLLERRRIVAEPEDVGLERVRFDSFIRGLADAEALVQPVSGKATIMMPTCGVGNSVRTVPIDVPRQRGPRLALVETWELSLVPGEYGLGRILQTFSLMPGERITVAVQTWRSDAVTREDATSIFDSSDVAAQTRFTSALMSATGAELEDQGGWAASVVTSAKAGSGAGIVSGRVRNMTLFAAGHLESSRRWSRAIGSAASAHAAQVNNSRRQAVQASSSTTAESGTAVTTVRRLVNKNRRRVLNYVFRELNQTYEIQVILKDIKVAFYNGNPGSAEVVPLTDVGKLLEDHVVDAATQKQAVQKLLSLCAQRVDAADKVRPTLEYADTTKAFVYDWKTPKLDANGEIGLKEELLKPPVRWRFTPRHAGQDVDGVLTDSSSVVLRTDSVMVEALLGQADAMDPYEAARQALDLGDRGARIAVRAAKAAGIARTTPTSRDLQS